MLTPTDPAQCLRSEVALLRARESRRVFDTAVYVGALAGDRQSVVLASRDLPVVDLALRTDLVSRLLENAEAVDAGGVFVWLTRAGGVETYDSDLSWLAASASACREHALELRGFYVVTRRGWLNLRTGGCRTWKRLRV